MEKAGMYVRLFFKENTTGIIERKIYGDGGTVTKINSLVHKIM